MAIEDTFAYELTKLGIDKTPARKAAQVLKYYKEVHDNSLFPPTQRIPMIWEGMMRLGITPYVDKNAERMGDLSPEHSRIYHVLDSIAIGIAVGVSRKLLAVCEHTKYAITAKGVEFTQVTEK